MKDSPFLVIAFYRFAAIDDRSELRRALYAAGWHFDLRGTVIVAPEGINASLCGTRESVQGFLEVLGQDARFINLSVRVTGADRPPFAKFWVKFKREIVPLGDLDVDPNQRVGEYVDPSDWNRLIDDPEVLVLDTRNDYEIAEGTFDGAIDPQITHFREFTEYVARELTPHRDRPVAMFCTGGIRCEKASAYLLKQGFERVYHLRGGILAYLEQTPEADSRWRGDCFVFDDRRRVDTDLHG